MKTLYPAVSLLATASAFRKAILSLSFLLIISGSLFAQQIVINQVYAGGGTAGAKYNASYVQLLNQGTNYSISLNGMSLQYANAQGSGWHEIDLPNVTLLPGQAYVVAGTGTIQNGLVVIADLTNTTLNLNQNGGTVALKSDQTLISSCPATSPDATVIEFVGYGSSQCYYGKPASALPNTGSLWRKSTTSNSSATGSNFAKFWAAPADPVALIPTGTLPVRLYEFTASATGQGNLLKWKASVTAASSIEVQRSENQADFKTIAVFLPDVNTDQNYSFNDRTAQAPKVYYRLRMTDEAQKVTYSNTLELANIARDAFATLFPTMATDKVTIEFSGMNNQNINYTVLSLDGRILAKNIVSANQALVIPVSNFAKGQYLVQLQTASGKTQVVKFIKE